MDEGKSRERVGGLSSLGFFGFCQNVRREQVRALPQDSSSPNPDCLISYRGFILPVYHREDAGDSHGVADEGYNPEPPSAA